MKLIENMKEIKEKDLNKIKNNNMQGITLIALVITIVILIILAGVAISLSLGNNGIFNKAQYAKEQQKMSEVKEKIELAIVDIQADKISKGEECTVDTIISELPGKVSGLEISKDGENGKGIYNGCDFTITPDLKVTIDGYNPSTGGSSTGEGSGTGEGTLQEVSDLKTQSTYFEAPTTVQDSNGNLIKVPAGFKIASDSGDNVTEGIVIEDNDIIEGKGNNRGNQYVWIPVGEGIKKSDGTTVDITLGRYDFADGTNDKASDGTTVLAKGTPILKQNAENYTSAVLIDTYYKELATYRVGVESSGKDGLNRTFRGKQLSDESYEGIKSFIDSVNENGGYYIARYEASYGTDGKANSKVSNSYTDSKTAPTTRTEGMLWNWITQINAAVACENLYTTVNSDLINSYAWDTAIVYIQKFSEDTDYSRQNSLNTSLGNTGRTDSTKDEVCKINDMASNTDEWTTEYSTDTGSSYAGPCTPRGGRCSDTGYYTSFRYDYNATSSYRFTAFRSALYM